MKLTRKSIISAISAITALSVAVTAICVANNRPETVIEYKIEDNFEITENMSVSFGEGGFTYDEFWGIPGDNWLDPVYSDNTEQTPSFYAEDYAGYTSDTEPMQIYEDMLVSYTGTEETVVIPDYVREISGHSFDGNWYVRCVILPVSVIAINMDALAGAPNLTEVVYLGTAEQWSSVYLAPGAIPEGISVIIAPPRPETEETDVPGEEPVEEETTVPTEESVDESTEETTIPAEEPVDDTTEETTAPDEEPVDDTTEETTAPDEESVDDTTEETTAPDEEPVDDTTEETTAPDEEPVDDTTEDTTVPDEEPADDTTEETTAPDEEPVDDTTEETTAPDEEPVDDTTEETTAPAEEPDESTEETTVPVEEPVTEDTASDTTVYSPVIYEYIPLAPADAADFTPESIPVTPENDKTDETTLPSAAEEDAAMPDAETDSVSEPETEPKPESEPEEAQTEPEAPKQKTISLISQLSGLSGGKTKIAARMSYFPTSAVVSVTNSADAENTAAQLGFDGSYYAFEVDIYDADTGELIPSLNGNITIDIGVPVILSESANIYAYHIADGVPELIPCGFVMSSDGIRMVQFAASAFSPFVLTDHEFIAPQETIAENLPLTDETEQAVEDETSEDSNNSEEAAADNESLDEESNTEDNDDINEGSNAGENNDVDEEPIIKVTFPSSASFIINPYKLDIQVSDTETSNAPVISPEISVTSESNCKIAVYMTATAYNIPDTVRYSDTYLTNGEEEKSIFMYAEAGHYNESTDSYSYTNYYNGASGQIPVTSYGGVSGKLLELDAVEEGSSAEGRFRLFGQTYMPSYDLWKENETVDVLMVFRVETVSDNIQELR